jgi:Na+/melibiose symporter-like transporter
MDHVRHPENDWRLELENSYPFPRCCTARPAHILILAAGISKVSDKPMSTNALRPNKALFRFLVAKGFDDKAWALLTKYHAGGDANSTLVALEVVQIRNTIRSEINTEKRPTLRKLLATPSNRRRLLISAIVGTAGQWAGNTVVSYYLTLVLDGIGIKNATHQSLINGGLQIFNLIATVACGAMLVDVLGRRRLFQWSAVGMTVSYVVCYLQNAILMNLTVEFAL